ncbi:MAG: hypothetical protein R3C01_10520 [Planctomycetaceae bacterium]
MYKLLSILVMGVVFSLSGCGGGEPVPDMYHLSGKITFEGQPVQNGSIFFEPTVAGGGHVGFAVIKDGAYDTKAEGGKGHAGGKLNVRIVPTGPPRTDTADDSPNPGPFPEWSVEEEFPKSDSTKDFEVPAEAKNPKKSGVKRNDA